MQTNHGTVLITGASAGIGRELAIEFAPRAERLVLVARRVDRLQELREELVSRYPQLGVVVMAADLSEEAGVTALLEKLEAGVGIIDILVNNAGMGDSVLFDRATWPRTAQLLRTNVLAVAQLTAALVPGMVKRGYGGIMNIGSGVGHTVMPLAAAYVGSKHFIAGFSEGLLVDLAGTGITITQVCPGPVETEFNDVAGASGGLAGAPPKVFVIGAAQCAREAVRAFEQGKAIVFPGQPYRTLMKLLPFVPKWMQRNQSARLAIKIRKQQRAGD